MRDVEIKLHQSERRYCWAWVAILLNGLHSFEQLTTENMQLRMKIEELNVQGSLFSSMCVYFLLIGGL